MVLRIRRHVPQSLDLSDLVLQVRNMGFKHGAFSCRESAGRAWTVSRSSSAVADTRATNSHSTVLSAREKRVAIVTDDLGFPAIQQRQQYEQRPADPTNDTLYRGAQLTRPWCPHTDTSTSLYPRHPAPRHLSHPSRCAHNSIIARAKQHTCRFAVPMRLP